ncbi:MAG: hypothetical protein V1778_04005 [bacterium]
MSVLYTFGGIMWGWTAQWPVLIPIATFGLLTWGMRWCLLNCVVSGEPEAYFHWGIGHGMLCAVCYIPLAVSIWGAGRLMVVKPSPNATGIVCSVTFFLSLGTWMWLYHKADLANDALIEASRKAARAV